MAKIKSNKTKINCSIGKIYDFISDFNNFRNLMPNQITNWQSTGDTCSFNVSGIGNLALKIKEKFQNEKIIIIPDSRNKIPFTFELICHLEDIVGEQTEVEFVFDHEMPAMIAMMASRPLQNMVDIFASKLKEYAERPGF